MKLIMAVIDPPKFEGVRKALSEFGIKGLMVSEVMGHGRQAGHTEIYRGAEYEVNFISKVKLEIVVPEEVAEQVVAIVGEAARSDRIGAGKVFVFDVSDAVRVRTGETGHDAL